MSSSSSTTSITLSIPGQQRRSKFISFVNSRNLIGYNIFRLKGESFKFMNSMNLIKDYNIKKIYPNRIKVYLESAKAISVIKYFNELVVLGNNGKIINLENLPKNLPKVIGTNDIKKIFQTLKIIDESNLNIENISKIEFFPSERIDVELKNKKKIKFPINLTIDNLNFGLKLIEDHEFNKSNILDLRIPNKVITYD